MNLTVLTFEHRKDKIPLRLIGLEQVLKVIWIKTILDFKNISILNQSEQIALHTSKYIEVYLKNNFARFK